MKNQFSFLVVGVIVVVLQENYAHAMASPLYTNSRWIVDGHGNRVKLACVNWPSHLQPMFAEGLSKQPLDVVSKKIRSMGFNCVRFTWPLYLVTNGSLASATVRQSFENLKLSESIAGIEAYNPSLLDLPLLQAFQAVVSNMGDNDVMVILDNHLTVPGWCCSRDDGNGFFGDQYFDPGLWLKGLSRMATIFRGTKSVVGMSLRNELRGPRQNVDLWYRYMQQGAEVVHAANPNVLVIISGLDFDTNLSFLKNKHVNLSFTRKLVFEMHWYTFTAGNSAWAKHNANQMCGSVVNGMMGRTGYLVQQGWPMFLSEYGVNLSVEDVYDARYLACLLGVVADLDLDWALWSLQGSYYFRQGVKDMDETYGVLSSNWSEIRNPGFLKKITFIQDPFQGPGLSASPYNIVYHPSSGLCILNQNNNLKVGSCTESKAWNYTQQKTIILKETNLCLQAVGLGKPLVLASACTDSSSQWEIIADSRMHLSAKLADGNSVCLDSDKNGVIITNQCRCLYNDIECNPASQWFKIISSSRSLPN